MNMANLSSEIISIFTYLGGVPAILMTLIGFAMAGSAIYVLIRKYFPKKTQKPKNPPEPPEELLKAEEGGNKESGFWSKAKSKIGHLSFPERVKIRRISIPHLQQSFQQNLARVQQRGSGKNSHYKTPWFLMLGETGSGKSTALAHNGLPLALTNPTRYQNPEYPKGCDWWVFNDGVVLEPTGDCVLYEDEKTGHWVADEIGWKQFLKLLQKARPRRPIDGVILTIPATDLIGDKQTQNVLEQKGGILYQKLIDAQKVLGIRFPIYVLITHTDKVKGFKNFFQIIPEHMQKDIFGWSNAYALEKIYDAQLVEEAFRKVYRDLNELQIELVTDRADIPDNDHFLLFPHALRPVFSKLKHYLNQTFKASVFHEPFFFRGIYFTGDSGQGQPMLGESLESPHYKASDDIDFKADTAESLRIQPTPAFLTRLYQDKIFQESGLALPVRQAHQERHRTLQAVQGTLLLLLIGGGVSQWYAFSMLEEDIEILMPVLEKIKKNEQSLTELEANLTLDKSYFAELTRMEQTSAEDLLKGLASISTEGLESIYIPSSWFSDVDGNLTQALSASYSMFISKWLRNGLYRKAQQLIVLNPPQLSEEEDADGDAIAELSQFNELTEYVKKVKELYFYTQSYQELQKNGAQNDGLKTLTNRVGDLVAYLYNIKLPLDFYTDRRISTEAIRKAKYEAFDLSAFHDSAQKRLKKLERLFFNRIYQSNTLLADIRLLAQTLNNLSQTNQHTEWFDILTQLNKDIKSIAQYIETPEHAWVVAPEFELGPEFAQLLLDIKEFPLFGMPERDDLMQTGQYGFEAFHDELQSYKSELVGQILVQRKENQGSDTDSKQEATSSEKSLVLANAVLNLKKILTSFLEKDFMAGVKAPRPLLAELPLSKRLLWDNARLRKAVTLAESFQNFVDNELKQLPDVLQPIALRAGHYQLHENMREHIAQAQTVTSQTREVGAEFERSLRADVENFAKAAELINWLLEAFEVLKASDYYQDRFTATYEDVESISVLQAHRLLAKVDKLLREDDLYTPKETEYFNDWEEATSQLAFVVFNVADTEELLHYLTVQRDRVHFLAENFAQSILSFMSGKQLPASFGQSDVLPRWNRIYQELYKYDNEKPDNSVAKLEEFIQFKLNEITPENCYSHLYNSDFGQSSGDYFLQKRADLQFVLFEQCEARQSYLTEVDTSDKLPLKTELPIGQNMFWDVDKLQAAVRRAEQFGKFVADELPKLPPEQQAMARDNGYAQFHANIIDMIARAQFLDTHLWQRGTSFEEGLQSEIQNFTDAAPILDWFIKYFEQAANVENDHQADFRESAIALGQLGALQAYRLLTHTDALLKEDNLYAPKPEFVNWGGSEKLSTLAYGPRDNVEMTHYLSTQRDRVLFLSANFAGPLLNFIAGKTAPAESANSDILPSWNRIYTQLSNYTNAKPENTVAELQNFIGFEMDKLTEQNCYSQLYAAGLNQNSGDYFVQKKLTLLKAIYKGCQSSSGYLADKVQTEGKRDLVTKLPLGEGLLWDADKLQAAMQYAQAFGNFVEKELPLLPEDQQQRARTIGYEQFHIDLVDKLAQAQQFEPLRSGGSLERSLQANVANFREAGPALDWFIQFFDQLSKLNTEQQAVLIDTRDALSRLGVVQAYRLLSQTDNLLLEDDLYKPSRELQNWDGKEKLTVLAYGAEKQEELQFYLSTQRDRVMFLARNYAQPLLSFLGGKAIPAEYGLQDVIPRWTRIYQELFKYDNEKPDNTLARLEDFVLTKMNKVNLSNCYERLAHGGLGSSTGDYFLDRKEKLALDVYLRCQYIADLEAFKRYQVLADYFNQNLAGRFPFAPVSSQEFFDEVNPENVQDFFLLFNEYGKGLQPFFQQTASFGQQRQQVVQWLDQIARVQMFMDSLLKQPLPVESALYDVTVDFRVNQANEVGANQIIAWELEKSNQVKKPSLSGLPLKGRRPNLIANREGSWHFADRWYFGEALRFSLRWARNSAFRPYYDGLQKNYRLGGQDDTAIFEFNSQWALLELLMKHKGNPGDYGQFEDVQPYTLKFKVPIKRLLPGLRVNEEPLRRLEKAPPPPPPPECYMDWYEESFGDKRCLEDGYRKADSSDNEFHAQGKDDEDLVVGRRHSTTYPLLSEQDAPYPGRQLPNGELAAEDVRKYAARYSEEFEENSEAIVFIRLTLTMPDQKERLIMPEFPDHAPALGGIAGKMRRHESNVSVFKTLLPPEGFGAEQLAPLTAPLPAAESQAATEGK